MPIFKVNIYNVSVDFVALQFKLKAYKDRPKYGVDIETFCGETTDKHRIVPAIIDHYVLGANKQPVHILIFV